MDLTTRAFNLADARRHGLSKDHLLGSSWRRLGGGYYAWHKIADNPEVILTAVSRRLPQVVFAGRTAAWLHGLDLPPCNPIEVTLDPAGPTTHLSGIRVRRSVVLPQETCRRRDLRTTSIDRTIADLARHLPLVEAVAAADMAIHRRLVAVTNLETWLVRHPGHPGVRRLRRVIDLVEPATESVMETRLRLLLVLGGLPRPQAQVSLRDEDGRFLGRPDLYYPAQRLVLEYDGAGHRESLVADNLRQNRLVDAGYRVLRFTAPDVLSAPDSVIELVRRALR
jgi:hypothetical protein